MVNVNELVSQLTIYADFYERGKPIVSDAEFDLLENQLREIDPDNAYFKRVGSAVRGVKVTHKIPMGSLTQFDSDDEIQKWIKKYDLEDEIFVISSKYDGSSINIEYDEHGHFLRAATRGDGIEGLDITRHIRRHIDSEHSNIPARVLIRNLIVRGEAILDINNFEIINKNGKYKNPRNYLAGQLNRKVADQEFIDILEFYAFDANVPGTKMDILNLLREENFAPVNHKVFSATDIKTEFLSSRLDKLKEASCFELDGLVIDVNHEGKRNEIGFQDLNPEYARKFKINKNFELTTVIDVHWAASKDGYLKPRVEIDPVELAGVTISFATGFNAKFINDNKIGPGATVKIVRSGDVIPYIQEVIFGSFASLPDTSNCHWNETGVDLVLNEIPDQSRILQAVDFFTAIDAPLLKEGNLTMLFEAGFDTITRIITASEHDLVTVLGENGYKVYIGLKEKLNPIEEWRLAGATPFFGRGVGQRKIKKLIETLGYITDNKSEILTVDGFEEKTADKVVAGYKDYQNFLIGTEGLITIKYYEKISGSLDNVVVVFTGVRDKSLEQFIESNGGKVASSFTKEVNVVVAKDPNGNTGKLKKARDAGIEIISLQEAQERWKN